MKSESLIRIPFAVSTMFFVENTRIASAAETTFDGTWSVTLTTPENKDPTGVVARGYVFHFPAQVQNGVLRGERGTRGAPGYFEISGQIGANGAAVLRASGITGKEEYNLWGGDPGSPHARSGKPYSYNVNALFNGRHGTGKRIGGRIGNFEFSKG